MANYFLLELDTVGPTGNQINMFDDAIVGDIVEYTLTANSTLGAATYAYIQNEEGKTRPVDIVVDGLNARGSINT